MPSIIWTQVHSESVMYINNFQIFFGWILSHIWQCRYVNIVEEKNLVKFLELQNLYFYFIIAQNREETN